MKRLFVVFTTLFLVSCAPKVWHTAGVYQSNTRVTSSSTEFDPEMSGLIEPYKKQEESKMKSIVAVCDAQLVKAKPESPLTNMIADMIQESLFIKTGEKVDATIVNYGGVRLSALPKGEISLGKVYELMPFDNMAVVLRIPGAKLKMLCDLIAKSGGWPVSNSLQFEISNEEAQHISINGEILDSSKIYRICLPDYVANGGDDCAFLTDVPNTTYQYLLRDAILDGFRRISEKGGKINYSTDGRIRNSNWNHEKETVH